MAKQPEQHHLSDHELLGLMLGKTRAFLRKNGLHVLTAVCLLLLAVYAIRAYSARREVARIDAWKTLSSQESVADLGRLGASSPENAAYVAQRSDELIEQCRRIIADTPGSGAAPWARIKLAGLLSLNRKWDEAAATYRDVIERYPDTPFAQMARPALAATLEDQSKYADAANLYEQLAEKEAVYWLSAARCRELQGEGNAARDIYNRLADPAQPAGLREAAEARLVALRNGEILTPPPPLDRPKPPTFTPPEEKEEGTGPAEDSPIAETPLTP